MKLLADPPPGFVAVPLKGAMLVISERVYVAGLKLGKALRRREVLMKRDMGRDVRARSAENTTSAEVIPDARGVDLCYAQCRATSTTVAL